MYTLHMQICKNLAKLGVEYLRYVFFVFLFSFYFSILYGACVKLKLIPIEYILKLVL